jgi:hypothetical protein
MASILPCLEEAEENRRPILPLRPHALHLLGIVELFRNPVFLRAMPQHGNLRQLVEDFFS